MKVLVVGSGGREHAIAWKLAHSPKITHVLVAPGNAGSAREPLVENIPVTDIQGLVELARSRGVQYTVVGPEAPLAAGIVDAFREAGLRIFGPSREAAQLESSKDYAKRFLARHGIPTARYQTFSDAQAAHKYLNTVGAPIVIKADGLAAGKGVVVAMTLAEAHSAIDRMLVDNSMGDAGARVVIEEFMRGEEASFIVMANGSDVLALATSQDHKRLKDQDTGPNTGGMGAYSPAPVVTPEVHARVMREIIHPTLAGMNADGLPYTGFLYAGLMIDESGQPRVVEFNCRLGDPETQPILMRLKTDLSDLIEAGIDGRLHGIEAEWDRRVSLGVVLAAEGYPEAPRKGDIIKGLPDVADDVHVFHAGTTLENGEVITSGGRVLCVTALGDNIRHAQKAAYAVADGIVFKGRQYRRDIGFRAVARKG